MLFQLLILVVLWGVVYAFVNRSLKRDVFPFTAYVVAVSTLLVSDAFRCRARARWLWATIPFALTLFLSGTAAKFADRVTQSPAAQMNRRFGWSVITLFAFIFFWMLLAPGYPLRGTNARRLLIGAGLVVGSLQVCWALLFLKRLDAATTIDQIRDSIKTLIPAALVSYAFLIVKIAMARASPDPSAGGGP